MSLLEAMDEIRGTALRTAVGERLMVFSDSLTL